MSDSSSVESRLVKELYMSIDRMHEHMVNGNQDAAQAERWHQRALRKDFKKVQKKD